MKTTVCLITIMTGLLIAIPAYATEAQQKTANAMTLAVVSYGGHAYERHHYRGPQKYRYDHGNYDRRWERNRYRGYHGAYDRHYEYRYGGGWDRRMQSDWDLRNEYYKRGFDPYRSYRYERENVWPNQYYRDRNIRDKR